MALLPFQTAAVDGNLTDAAPQAPIGTHQAVVKSTELLPPNAEGTQQLCIIWDVFVNSETYEIREYATISCPKNNIAQEIGMRFLKNLCESLSMAAFNDTDELIGKPHYIKIREGKRERKDGKKYNEVAITYPIGAQPVATPPVQTAPLQPPVAQQSSPSFFTPPATAIPPTTPPSAPTSAAARPPWQK